MNKVLAMCLLGCLTPNGAMSQSALEHHVWQDARIFEPSSRTAALITGKIKLSGLPVFAAPGKKMNITFGNGKSAVLTSVGAFWREWSDVVHDKVTAEVFRFDHDPGKLEHGNTLCDGDARYIAFYELTYFAGTDLGVIVFKSEHVPKDGNDPAICGTFNYKI